MRVLIIVVALVIQLPTLSPLCVRAQYLAAHNPQHPGNPGHRAPPDGYYCETRHTDPAKRCACHRVDTSPDCESDPIEDNAQCLVACHKAHCHCDVVCQPGAGAPVPEEE